MIQLSIVLFGVFNIQDSHFIISRCPDEHLTRLLLVIVMQAPLAAHCTQAERMALIAINTTSHLISNAHLYRAVYLCSQNDHTRQPRPTFLHNSSLWNAALASRSGPSRTTELYHEINPETALGMSYSAATTSTVVFTLATLVKSLATKIKRT